MSSSTGEPNPWNAEQEDDFFRDPETQEEKDQAFLKREALPGITSRLLEKLFPNSSSLGSEVTYWEKEGGTPHSDPDESGISLVKEHYPKYVQAYFRLSIFQVFSSSPHSLIWQDVFQQAVHSRNFQQSYPPMNEKNLKENFLFVAQQIERNFQDVLKVELEKNSADKGV